jgi:hypothetical protein
MKKGGGGENLGSPTWIRTLIYAWGEFSSSSFAEGFVSDTFVATGEHEQAAPAARSCRGLRIHFAKGADDIVRILLAELRVHQNAAEPIKNRNRAGA